MNGITSDLARDEFLQMMVAQIQHQDPLEPTSQTDMLGQLAQFSTLEGIEGLNHSFSEMLQLQQQAQTTNLLQQGSELIGQTVVLDTAGLTSPTGQQGRIDSVALERGQLLLEINGKPVPLDRVIGVIGAESVLHTTSSAEPEAEPATSQATSEGDASTENLSTQSTPPT